MMPTPVGLQSKIGWDICVNVKLGKWLQIAILIIPAIVLLGQMMGIDEMSKNFATF